MDTAETLEFFHIVFVLAFFSGVIVAMLTMARARSEPNIHTVRALVRIANHAATFLVILPLALTGVFGVVLADELDIPLSDTDWLNAAYAATIVAFLLALFVFGGQTRRAARLADRDTQQGTRSAELDAVLRSPITRLAGPALHVLVAYILVLMVFRPF